MVLPHYLLNAQVGASPSVPPEGFMHEPGCLPEVSKIHLSAPSHQGNVRVVEESGHNVILEMSWMGKRLMEGGHFRQVLCQVVPC